MGKNIWNLGVDYMTETGLLLAQHGGKMYLVQKQTQSGAELAFYYFFKFQRLV